jgi:hypothetical protein
VPEQESLINQTQADFGRLRIEESRLRLLLTPTARELARARQLEAALANLLPAPAIPIQTPTPRARPVEDPDSTSSQEPTPPPDDDILTPPPAKAKLSESYRFITIRCNSRTLLDPKKFIVVFQEDVVLEHPEFRLNCEELVVHRGEGDAEIKKAVATGPMVIIERRNPEGVLEEARCRRAVFENDELVLLDYPQIRRDRVVIRATSPRTRLVIPRNAKAYFDGPSQTIGADKVDDADAENP